MAKRTAIIDIGSNSISMVVYEKSSRYAFHLIEKIRTGVRIGEGAYTKNGHLSDQAMDKAYGTIKDYLSVAKALGCRKVLSVATSALRDAPNKDIFVKKVSKDLSLNIKIIDGKKEAYLGAVAALNLLPDIDDATTVDIGGGSTELAKISQGKVVETISLNIGTVRLKELFNDTKEIKKYLKEFVTDLPEAFKSKTIIGIGGTARALSSAILEDTDYPIDSLHAFEYDYKEHRDFLKHISKADIKELEKSSIKESRYDTITEGCSAFYIICDHLDAKDILISKAGIREGVYLTDILRNSNHKFPHNFNVSIKSLVDRFAIYNKHIPYVSKVASNIYDATYKQFDPEMKHKKTLLMASKLLLITRRLNIYSNSEMGFDFLLENLNFMISHKDKILIATILRYSHKQEIRKKNMKKVKELLPDYNVVEWLTFILSLTICINKNKKIQKLDIKYKDGELSIISEKEMFLCGECVKELNLPNGVKKIIFQIEIFHSSF